MRVRGMNDSQTEHVKTAHGILKKRYVDYEIDMSLDGSKARIYALDIEGRYYAVPKCEGLFTGNDTADTLKNLCLAVIATDQQPGTSS